MGPYAKKNPVLLTVKPSLQVPLLFSLRKGIRPVWWFDENGLLRLRGVALFGGVACGRKCVTLGWALRFQKVKP